MTLTPEAKSLAMTLIEGAMKTIRNADELFDEARLLAGAGHIARALLLHQISLEECGKSEMLYVSVAAVLRGQAVDLRKLKRAFSRHEAKNNTNAYFLPRSEGEVTALEQNDTEAAADAFGEVREAFHKDSNTLKNASLYVDFDGAFRAPGEAITTEQLTEVLNRNGEFMSMALDKIRLLTRWATDLDAAANEVATLWSTLGMDELDRKKPETYEAFQKRLDGMLGSLDESASELGRLAPDA